MNTKKTQYQTICDLKDKYNTWLKGCDVMFESVEYKAWESRLKSDTLKAFEKIKSNDFFKYLECNDFELMSLCDGEYESNGKICITISALNVYEFISHTFNEKINLDEL